MIYPTLLKTHDGKRRLSLREVEDERDKLLKAKALVLKAFIVDPPDTICPDKVEPPADPPRRKPNGDV